MTKCRRGRQTSVEATVRPGFNGSARGPRGGGAAATGTRQVGQSKGLTGASLATRVDGFKTGATLTTGMLPP